MQPGRQRARGGGIVPANHLMGFGWRPDRCVSVAFEPVFIDLGFSSAVNIICRVNMVVQWTELLCVIGLREARKVRTTVQRSDAFLCRIIFVICYGFIRCGFSLIICSLLLCGPVPLLEFPGSLSCSGEFSNYFSGLCCRSSWREMI